MSRSPEMLREAILQRQKGAELARRCAGVTVVCGLSLKGNTTYWTQLE